MDCPLSCPDGETGASCPDASCPLYNGQTESCFLQQVEDSLARDETLPDATRAVLQRLQDAGRGLPPEHRSAESKLAFLVMEVEERRKSQEQLLQVLSRTEASDAALRGEVRTLAERLAALESGQGTLEERLGGVGRSLSALQTDQFRVAEQLVSDLSRPLEAMASRLEEGAAGTRRVLEELSGRTDNLVTQGKEMSREMRLAMVRQEEQSELAHGRQLSELNAALEGHLDSLGARMEEQTQRLESPLEGARAAMQTWQGEARQVLEALRQRHAEDERSRQRACEEESRELNARGVLLFHQDSVQAAERAFRRAVELRPDFAEAHNNLGLVQSRLGQEDDAVVSFEKAMSCGEQLPAALNNLGFLYHAQMRDAEAVEMFRKALQSDPAMAPALVNLGNACYRQGHHTEALDAWRRALELDPVNEDAQRAIRSFDLQADTARS